MEKMNKNSKKQTYLGVTNMIKLPYVIGTPEYYKHPYSGIVYIGGLEAGLEQEDLHKEEQK